MSLAVQFQTMFAMVAMGLVLGMNLDFYHRLTIRSVKAFWARLAWDLLFWLVQVLLVFYVLLHVNEGELRIYIFFSIAAGFFIYRRYGRSPFIKTMELGFSIVRWTRRTIAALIRIFIISPIKFILKLITSSVMIGITISGNVLFFLLNLLLFPLKLAARYLYPVFRRLLPQPIITFLEKTFQSVRKRVKKWRIFK
ncbi:spore cortex biosynthesis protein YabQ [Alteribacillus sp. YIM 98480]|uniref:spore cortex biosynthesis protein YabQ n=1 Tax=Alteribacillus sp. YIM 98480 TaxID=2606599 RepID=UPI00131D7A1A|nr:spore cortex biosynthesis protein YabQ [Alteribacillus sp. YIM 98480]